MIWLAIGVGGVLLLIVGAVVYMAFKIREPQGEPEWLTDFQKGDFDGNDAH